MKALKIGISGVRGIVGEAFTPEVAVSFAQAFGTYLDGGKILVCRDTRPSGPMVSSAVMAGLLASGCEVVDLGVCPTPSMQLAVPRLAAQGGISITAGHNPAPWNALKFVRADGLYLNEMQAEELLDIFHQGEFEKATWDRIRTSIGIGDAVGHHIDALRRPFDIDAIRAMPEVSVDCCNNACAVRFPAGRAAGLRVLAINDDVTAPFPHDPEPRLETMAQVRALVKAGRADIGFVHDADGERLGIVDEAGNPLSEELTLVLATAIALGRKSGPVVTNISTTRLIDRMAGRYGASVIRTPVGQAYISEAIVEHGAIIGGEGNGSGAVPAVQASHDSAAAIGLLLDHMARSGTTVSAMVVELPRLAMLKQKVPIEPNLIFSALQDFRETVLSLSGVSVDLTDGVKVDWPDGWVHVRASNTESLIRVIAEADDVARAGELADWARDRLRQ
jgi:phosphomannomutase